MTDVVRHEHNPDRTRENGWAYWRCTGCGELCHYSRPDLSGYDMCACCAEVWAMPCLVCGDPCQVEDYATHIRSKHPACPECNVLAGTALGTDHAPDCRFCEGDRIAGEELARGEGRRFDSVAAAAEWREDGAE